MLGRRGSGGVHCLFDEGYALNPIREQMRKWGTPLWLAKPLYICPPCMSSVHGFAISAIYFDWHIYPMLAYMVCLCGVNYIIKSILFPEYE